MASLRDFAALAAPVLKADGYRKRGLTFTRRTPLGDAAVVVLYPFSVSDTKVGFQAIMGMAPLASSGILGRRPVRTAEDPVPELDVVWRFPIKVPLAYAPGRDFGPETIWQFNDDSLTSCGDAFTELLTEDVLPRLARYLDMKELRRALLDGELGRGHTSIREEFLALLLNASLGYRGDVEDGLRRLEPQFRNAPVAVRARQMFESGMPTDTEMPSGVGWVGHEGAYGCLIVADADPDPDREFDDPAVIAETALLPGWTARWAAHSMLGSEPGQFIAEVAGSTGQPALLFEILDSTIAFVYGSEPEGDPWIICLTRQSVLREPDLEPLLLAGLGPVESGEALRRWARRANVAIVDDLSRSVVTGDGAENGEEACLALLGALGLLTR
jgi:hypothetical protein